MAGFLCWHPQREFAAPCKVSDTETARQCYEPNSASRVWLLCQSCFAIRCANTDKPPRGDEFEHWESPRKKACQRQTLRWHPQRESNSQLTLRRGLLYPFNYGGVLFDWIAFFALSKALSARRRSPTRRACYIPQPSHSRQSRLAGSACPTPCFGQSCVAKTILNCFCLASI